MNTKGKIVNFRPLLFIGLILIIGILISSLTIFYKFSYSVILLSVLLISLIRVLIFSLKGKNYKIFISVIVSIILLILCVFSFYNAKSKYDNANYSADAYLKGYVTEIKSNDNNYSQIVVKADLNNLTNKIIVEIPAKYKVYVGNKIEFKCEVYKNYYSYNGKFNLYPLINNEYYYATNVENVRVYKEFDGVISKLKYKIITLLQKYMPNGYGFSYALLVGDTSYLKGDSILGFRYTGVAHIFAVSGLHVGFLYGFLKLALKILKVKKKPSIMIILSLIFLYVWFCGFSPSCLRAFYIILFVSLSEILDFKYDKISVLFLSAILILLINPLYLFDLGFLLSYTAYSSIILLTRPISRWFSKFLPDKIAKHLAPYISAYLGVMPISISSFGYYSAFSMLFNMIIVPIISVVYILNFIAVVGLLISTHLSFLCILPEISFVLITKFITSINYYAFLLKEIDLGLSTFFYYLMLIMMLDEINISTKIRKNMIYSLFIVFIMSVFVINLGN